MLFAGGCWALNRIREAVFRDRAPTQMVLTFLFCAGVYTLWTIVDVYLGGGSLGTRMLQALALAAYTGLLSPLAHRTMRRVDRLVLTAPSGRRGR